jgi:hypothetical protein
VHAQRVDTLPRPRDDARELLRLLSGYRWRLGSEGVLRLGVRGLIAGAALVVVASSLSWLLELALPVSLLAALVGVPLGGALAWALVGWPNHAQTARALDQRLGMAERMATAVELRSRPLGRFDGLQLRDATTQLRLVQQQWPIRGGARREVVLALALSMAAVLSLVLGNVPRPRIDNSLDTSLVAQPDGNTEARAALPGVLEQRGLDAPSATDQTSDADLAPRVKQAQAEQDALNRLSQALGQVSAAQGAADAIQQGDYASAKEQLAALGEEADQLSDAAKRQLAQALQNAANTTGTDRQLADRERQAAAALTRSNYSDQRQALRALGDQVERSGSRSLPASQLARDEGRLQQQSGSSGQPNGGQGATSGQSGIQSQQAAGQDSAAGGQSTDSGGASDQGGPGIGSGSTDGVGDPSGRLATAGQQVDVPTKLTAGSGVRPPSGGEDQVGTNPGAASRSVIEAAQTQQTGQIAPEQNLVPSEQRQVIRGYFR